MAISIAIPNVKSLGTGVWKAKLAPEDLDLLGGGEHQFGPLSVLLLSNAPSFDRATNTLRISLTSARVLNLGNTHDTIIVESRAPLEGNMKSNFPIFAIQVPGQSARTITALLNR